MRIGVDLGGTKIEIIAIAGDGTELLKRRVPTPRGEYDATIRAICELVSAAEAKLRDQGTVGVGLPGAICPGTGLIKNANSTWLIGKPFDRDLSGALGRPVRLANDADCFALSEATDGAGADARSLFGVILGTGVGGGIVIDGKLLSGANAIAGEWGHNPLPWPTDDERPGPTCYCGRHGCIETFLSGPGLAADHFGVTGQTMTAQQIVAAAEAGDPDACASLDRYHDRLARALAHVVNILDPEVIVLGGGLSEIDSLYDRVPARWGRYIFSGHVATRLVRARHGASGGVRGAAWLWPNSPSGQR